MKTKGWIRTAIENIGTKKTQKVGFSNRNDIFIEKKALASGSKKILYSNGDSSHIHVMNSLL